VKKFLLGWLLVLSVGMGSLYAEKPKDEINLKVASYVKHHIMFDNLEWNEGFKNSAKGIEYIHYLDEHNGIGVTYITFRNSYDIRTHAGGFVYKRIYDKILGIIPNTKAYMLYQKGYYGAWDNVLGYSTDGSDNKFWTPLASAGFEYEGFTVDVVGHHKYLYAVTFGYSFKVKGF